MRILPTSLLQFTGVSKQAPQNGDGEEFTYQGQSFWAIGHDAYAIRRADVEMLQAQKGKICKSWADANREKQELLKELAEQAI